MTEPNPDNPKRPDTRWVLRFHRYDRILHGVLMASFLSLALTGLPLLFAQAPWAARMAGLFGGYGVTSYLHRTAAATLFACFTLHLTRVLHRLYVRKEMGLLWGPDSLVPQPKDVVQMLQHMRWFLRLGPRPRFDRYTYWEKFDYFAVFWGMAVIGTSGLMLWFPGLFARIVPGWVFNIALVVHGEEALLAMVFIFTVHFFNGHIRPEKFPMDTVIFTGRVSLEELEQDRPAEYERLLRSGKLEEALATPPSHRLDLAGRLVGTTAVALGFVMVVLSVYALLAW
jgi:cytochrome b subunit of formate dehydrogenase